MGDANKKTEWLAKLWVGMKINGEDMKTTNFVVFNPHDKDMDEKTNEVKPLPDHVLEFLDAFPAVAIKSAQVKQVDTNNFDAAVVEQLKVDKSNSWEDILKDIVKNVGKRTVDMVFDVIPVPSAKKTRLF